MLMVVVVVESPTYCLSCCQVLREGMGQAALVANDVAADTVITNALIVDAVAGVIKADVGIKVMKQRLIFLVSLYMWQCFDM